MILIIIWLFFILCCMTGTIDTLVIQFLFISFLIVTTIGGLFCYAIVSEDERKKTKKKKTRLRREKRIQKEEAQRQKRQSKENQRRRCKDERESRKRRQKDERQEKKLQKLALKQAQKDFFAQRRLIEKNDRLQRKLQKKLDRHNRKEVMITQSIQNIQSAQSVQPYSKTKRDKPKSIKLTSFVLPIVVFLIMMSCIIGSQIISIQSQNSYTQAITDYYYVGYDDSS